MGYLLGYVYPGPESYRWAFILFGLFSGVTLAYIWRFLPSVGKDERLTPPGFTFKAGEFKLLLAFEALLTLAWELAPEIVLLNYIVFTLKKTVFEVTLVAVVSSLASILGTYASERFPKGRGFQGMSLGMLINALYAALMMVSPPFWLVIIAYSLDAFGGTFWFPFYRSWMFKLIPKERVSEFHAAISSYRKMIGIVAPLIAGALASVHATLPYAFSLAFFLSAGLLLAAAPRRLPLT